MQYVIHLPSDFLVSMTVEAESKEEAEQYVMDTIRKHPLIAMSVDEEGNYTEIGNIGFTLTDWAATLDFYAGESTKPKERPGQKIVNRYQLTSSSRVEIDSLGNQILYSYSTPAIMKEPTGKLHRLWDGWTRTTGKHIRKFCGIYKSELDKLEVEDLL